MKKVNFLNLIEKGAVLITGLMFLLFLTIIGATALITTTNDVTISANYKSIKEAFYDAEAGLHFAASAIENGIKSWTFTMPTSGSPVDLDTEIGPAPAGYSFALGQLTREGYNTYRFRTTGTGSRGATAQIEARIRRGVGITMGAFGDKLLDLDSFTGYYSYDSNVTSTPDSLTSTGQGDVGSNGTIDPGAATNNVTVDGDVIFGNNGTVDAAYNDPAKPVQTVTGTDGEYIGHIDPDPLGMLVGNPTHLTSEVTYYSDPANNINDEEGILTSISGSTTLNQPGNYYFEKITGDLTIDASAGDINIYVRGSDKCIDLGDGDDLIIDYGDPATANKVQIFVSDNGLAYNKTLVQVANNSTINNKGKPTQFALLSDTDAHIELKNSSEFKGLLYAPKAYLDIKNGGNFYGAAWGSTFDSNNNAALYYDTNMAEAFVGKEIQLTSWMQIHN
jgi:Tfp pilus assembly protein PilX